MRLANAGVLYIVATPIGHLGDLTRRAEDVLKQVQIVAAEDTRRTRVLLDHIDHHVPELLSLHEHNEASMAQRLVKRLLEGSDVALVSDAGTPLVNDPGFLLVVAAHQAGITTVPIPGACSITAALSVCPLPTQPFRYVGFLPSKATARRQRLAEYLAGSDAIVFLEAPHRIIATVTDIGALSSRRMMLARELTKRFETILVGTAAEVRLALGDQPKGEFTCVIEAAESAVVTYNEQKLLIALLAELPPSKAAKVAANVCGAKKSAMYELAMRLSDP